MSPSSQTSFVEQLAHVHRQPESDEDDDLREAGQRHVEAPDLPLVRHVEVAEDEARR